MRSDRTEDGSQFHGIFIRAPGIVSINNTEDVKVLATLQTKSMDTERGLRNRANNLRGIYKIDNNIVNKKEFVQFIVKQ